MAGIPNSGVADKIREIDVQESHWKPDTMASSRNSGVEEKIRDSGDQESNWTSDWQKSEQIRKIQTSLVKYAEKNGGQGEVHIMKLPACLRKPAEQYTPEQWQFGLHNRDWQFGLHNRDLQASTTVMSYHESEGMKLRLAAACKLEPFTWDTFCADVVDVVSDETMSSYGLDPRETIFNWKEVQYLLTLDALTLLLVFTRLYLNRPDLVKILAKDTVAMESLLLSPMPTAGLFYDLFLFENQVPIALLRKVMNKSYEIMNEQKNRGLRELEILDLSSPQYFLEATLMGIGANMCFSVFIGPDRTDSDMDRMLTARDTIFPDGDIEKPAHVFSCFYRMLGTSPTTKLVEESVSATTKNSWASVYQRLLAMFGFYSQNATKSHLVGATKSGAHQKPDNPSQLPPNEESITVKPEEEKPEEDRKHKDDIIKSATELKKSGIRIEKSWGMLDEVAFKNGCLYLPVVILHDQTESIFRNLVMYEMFDKSDLDWRGGEFPFTNYIQLMGDLIKKKEDVEHLIERSVITNQLVTIENAFDMWNTLEKGLLASKYSEKYKLIVSEVNKKCDSKLSVVRTEFYELFCSRPWLVTGALTAIIVTLATLIQTYTAVIGSNRMLPHFPRGG